MAGKGSTLLVSVIIPAYNGENVIDRAITSVLEQSYDTHEIIVVDDGSTDSTASLLEKYGSDIHVVRQENEGTTAARNCGARYASGDYIAFLDQDDCWIPEKLEIQIEVLRRRPSIGLTFGNLEAVDNEGRSLGFMVNSRENCHPPSWEDLLLLFPLYPSTVLVRKSQFDEIGGFDVRFGLSGAYGDQDFHLRLREKTEFDFRDMCLGYYYWDEDRLGRVQRFLTNLPIYVEKYWNHRLLLDPRNNALRQRFVRKCYDELTYLMRRLLRLEGNEASGDMLSEINDYHRRFERTFEDTYVKLNGLESLDVLKYRLDTPLSTLLYLYLCRRDLQREFPEVRLGDLKRLFDWASKVARKVYRDIDNETLFPFGGCFEAPQEIGAVETAKTRSHLATYASGKGIEIGALGPLPLPNADEVIYVDVLGPEQLVQHYEDQTHAVRPDIVADGCVLPVRNSTLDFVVASHLFEHLTNPLKALDEWHRCLKPMGYLLLAIPDRRFTFDRNRDATTIRHLVRDLGADEPEEKLDLPHVQEWVEKVDGMKRGIDAFDKKVSYLLKHRSAIHKHVWTDMEFRDLIAFLTNFRTPFTTVEFVEATCDTREFLCLLQKLPTIEETKVSPWSLYKPDLIVDLFDLTSQLKAKFREGNDQLSRTEQRLRVALSELDAIHHSFGYKLMRFYSFRIDRAFPGGTARGEIRKIATASLRIIMEEGLIGYLRKVWEKICRQEFRIKESI